MRVGTLTFKAGRLPTTIAATALLGAALAPSAQATGNSSSDAVARAIVKAGRVSIQNAPGTQASNYIAPPAFGDGRQIEHLHYRYGPLTVRKGSNMIMIGGGLPKPPVDGYIVGIRPNLTLTNGTIPSVNVIHLHHGVWLNLSRKDLTDPTFPERFFASGEEKTWQQLPPGFGYPYKASDQWALNYMLHNLTPLTMSVYVDYEIDFVPATSPLAKTMKPAYPIWMDVENGKAYPVFDAKRGQGNNGIFTFPDNAASPYPNDTQPNDWTVPRDMTLVATGGHLHPGGLYDTLEDVRPGATPARGTGAGDVPNSVILFRSQAHYWDPRGAVSWDMAMTKSPTGWRVALKAGDTLRVTSAYDVKKQSWYEVMGIMNAWAVMGDGVKGADPFTTPVQTKGYITHGLLPENANPLGDVPIANLPNPIAEVGTIAENNTVQISNFTYTPGSLNEELGGGLSDPPIVKQGQSLTFVNDDNSMNIYHTVTGCSLPCTASTGVHYPLADNPPDTAFDSGELGTGQPGFTAAANTVTWKTPTNLAVGTYTYFCRVHPWMRGTFRVVK
jgi:plastocyanin